MTREDVLRCLGEFPKLEEPEAECGFVKTAGDIDYYRVSYFCEQSERVSAHLLLPASRQGKIPGVIACHQHGDEYFIGKSEPVGLYQRAANTFALTLCRAGFAVLCPDMLCFEDRRPSEIARHENPVLEGGSYERLMFMERLLHGSTLQAKYIADLCRAVDVLCALPEVDCERIGVCGHSLGGQEALWLAWYDPRVKAAVMSCGFAKIRDLQARGINHNFAMYLPGFLEKGDMQDILSMLCPKPAFVCHGALDRLYPEDSVRAVMEEARQAYSLAHHPDRLETKIYPNAGHVFEQEQQRDAVRFLLKWL